MLIDIPPPSQYLTTINKSYYEVREEGLTYMKEVTGWCSELKGAVLMNVVLKNKPQTIVEIGVWAGRSLIPMAYALKCLGQGVIYGIDPWDNQESTENLLADENIAWWGSVNHEEIYETLCKQVDDFTLKDQVILIKASSEQAQPIQEIDMLHIDGNHSENASFYDVNKWVPLVKAGGIIIMDDISWIEEGIPTTKKAVDWLDTHCLRVATFSEQCGWAIWIKK